MLPDLYECDECGRLVEHLHQPQGELVQLCDFCEALYELIGRAVTVRMRDGSTHVGRLTTFLDNEVFVEGVKIRRADIATVLAAP